MQKKIINRFIIIILISTAIITLFSIYQFRQSGIKATIEKAEIISELVKKGLTAHMINGNMDQKDVFLNSISSVHNVKNLWIVRSTLVDQQFGQHGTQHFPKDDLDRQVLKNGKMQYQFQEFGAEPTIRVTIPYNAEVNKYIDCIQCHNVNYGDTLGAISIELDISRAQIAGIKTIFFALTFLLFVVLIVIPFLNKMMRNHFEVINLLLERFNLLSVGVFKPIVQLDNEHVSEDSKKLIDQYNKLNEKLKNTFESIDKKLKTFIGNKTVTNENSIDNASEIISKLTLIYQFKKEIEQDDTKNAIYNRIAQIFVSQFNLKHFNIIEIDNKQRTATMALEYGAINICKEKIFENPRNCRATKTTNDVISSKYHQTCVCFNNDDYNYHCVHIDIDKHNKLVVNFIVNTQQELDALNLNMPFIKSYLYESAPLIEVHLLMEKLQQSAYTDSLTGLYNRKYLDESLKKLIPQAKREHFNMAILLLDIDHFKSVNDEYGHDVGDNILEDVAQILQDTIRDSDLAIRYGGEEFLVLLIGDNTENSILEVSEKIRENIEKFEFQIKPGYMIHKTISIGVSMFPFDTKEFPTAVKFADMALYKAKELGRNQVVRFTNNMSCDIDFFKGK